MDLVPLFDLRLRTPGLELRLPTRPELEELRELARDGVHPPDEMPFAVAWTDEPYSEEWVVAFHEQQREAWRPDDLQMLHVPELVRDEAVEQAGHERRHELPREGPSEEVAGEGGEGEAEEKGHVVDGDRAEAEETERHGQRGDADEVLAVRERVL